MVAFVLFAENVILSYKVEAALVEKSLQFAIFPKDVIGGRLLRNIMHMVRLVFNFCRSAVVDANEVAVPREYVNEGCLLDFCKSIEKMPKVRLDGVQIPITQLLPNRF